MITCEYCLSTSSNKYNLKKHHKTEKCKRRQNEIKNNNEKQVKEKDKEINLLRSLLLEAESKLNVNNIIFIED